MENGKLITSTKNFYILSWTVNSQLVTISLLITCIPEETDFEIDLFSQLSDLNDLDLDAGSGHTAYRHVSLIDLYQIPNSVEIGRTCGQTYGRTQRPALLGSRRSRPSEKCILLCYYKKW